MYIEIKKITYIISASGSPIFHRSESQHFNTRRAFKHEGVSHIKYGRFLTGNAFEYVDSRVGFVEFALQASDVGFQRRNFCRKRIYGGLRLLILRLQRIEFGFESFVAGGFVFSERSFCLTVLYDKVM